MLIGACTPVVCPMCVFRHVEVTIRLLVWGADPNKITPADGVSAAMLACQQGHLTLAQVLATFGANLAASTTDADHDTPRKLADQNGQLAMVSWLDAVDGWEPVRKARFLKIDGTEPPAPLHCTRFYESARAKVSPCP